MTESVGNASLGSSPSEDFLIGDFTENTNITYINDIFFVKHQLAWCVLYLKQYFKLQACTSGIHFHRHNTIMKILSNNTEDWLTFLRSVIPPDFGNYLSVNSITFYKNWIFTYFTYICVRVCVCVYVLYVCMHVCVCVYVMYACVQVHKHTCTHARTRTHAHSWRTSVFVIFQLPSQSQLNSYLKSSTKFTLPGKFGGTVQPIIKINLFYARSCFIYLHSPQNLNKNLTLLTDFAEKWIRGNFASRQYISLSMCRQ